MNGIVKYKAGSIIKSLTFEHAESLFREIAKTKGGIIPEITSNHEFINNELIIKPSKKRSRKPSKPIEGKEGDGLRESAEDTDTSI